MNAEQLKKAIDKIDDQLIAEAENYTPVKNRKKSTAVYIIPAAATAAAVAFGIGINNFSESNKPDNRFEAESVVTDTVPETTVPAENTESTELTVNIISVTETEAYNETTGTISCPETKVPDTEKILMVTDKLVSSVHSVVTHPASRTEKITTAEKVTIPEFTGEIPDSTVPECTSSPVTEPAPEDSPSLSDEAYDLYESVISSFPSNSIFLDYTRDKRTVLIIKEDGSKYFLEDGGVQSIIKMKDGTLPPEKEIRSNPECSIVRFIPNDDGTYTLWPSYLKDNVYKYLINDSNVLSVDEKQIINKYMISIDGITIDSKSNPGDIIKDYPELNLSITSESIVPTEPDPPVPSVSVPVVTRPENDNPAGAPDPNPETELTVTPSSESETINSYSCAIPGTSDSYDALIRLEESGAKYKFTINIPDFPCDEPYAAHATNIFKR